MMIRTSLVALGAIACGCGGNDSRPGPGDLAWTASAQVLVIAGEGGGLLPTPPKSECMAGSGEYTLGVSTMTLDSWHCEGVGTTPLKKVVRSRVITQDELLALTPSLEKLLVVDTKICGADKPAITLRVTDAAGTIEYRDSFYGCVADPRPQVDTNALDEVFGKLTTLVVGG